MRTIVISGSRNEEGRTARVAGALLDGMTAAGAEGEVVFLPALTVERCRQCDADGWGLCRAEGRCVIEDDFAGLVRRIGEADVVVFATPVYFSDLSESLRTFLDRLRRTARHENGRQALDGKPAVGICVAGGGGGATACAGILQKTLAMCGLDVQDMIPVRRQNLTLKLEVLRSTGRWLASDRPTED